MINIYFANLSHYKSGSNKFLIALILEKFGIIWIVIVWIVIIWLTYLVFTKLIKIYLASRNVNFIQDIIKYVIRQENLYKN